MLEDIFTGHALAGEYVFMLLCFAAAWMSGPFLANDWKPAWTLFAVALLLGAVPASCITRSTRPPSSASAAT